MANPEIYAITYWCHKGKHEETIAALYKLVPAEGEVPDADTNPALEKFRIASNCYYDLYNNGLCNRWEEFEEVFSFAGPYREDESDDEDDWRSQVDVDKAWWTVENVNRVEIVMNIIIEQAAQEQGIAIDGELTQPIPAVPSVPVALPEVEKPFVQLTGEDGNVFSIIGRVSGALKKARQSERAKEFSFKAMSSKSYDEVLRLAMEYCDVA